MKTCPSCGKDLPDEASFCVYCMTQLSPTTDVKPSATVSRKNKLSTVIIAVLLALVAALSVAVAVLAQSRSAGLTAPQNYSDLETQKSSAELEREQFCDSMQESNSKASDDMYGLYNPFICDETVSNETRSELYSCFKTTSGNIHVSLSHVTHCPYLCEIIGTTDVDFAHNGLLIGRNDSFKFMQLLYTAYTGKADTMVYDFLTDDGTYPFTENNADWTSEDGMYTTGSTWMRSQTTDALVITEHRKDATIDGVPVCLIERIRQYGDGITYYDFQFRML